MKNFIIAAIIIVLGVLGYRYFFPEPPPPPPAAPLTPDEMFNALLQQPQIPAERLGELAKTYPQVATKYLKNRTIFIKGTVRSFTVEGIDGNRVRLLLNGQPGKMVAIESDLYRYFDIGLSAQRNERSKYVIHGDELLHTPKNGEGRIVICRLGENVIVQSRFSRIVGSSVIFDAGLLPPSGH